MNENEAGRACSWPHNVFLSATDLQHMSGICCFPTKFWHTDAFHSQWDLARCKHASLLQHPVHPKAIAERLLCAVLLPESSTALKLLEGSNWRGYPDLKSTLVCNGGLHCGQIAGHSCRDCTTIYTWLDMKLMEQWKTDVCRKTKVKAIHKVALFGCLIMD